MFRKIIIAVTSLSTFLTSCVDARKATYFVGQGDASLPSSITIPQTVISKNDLLSITVTSLNPTASATFNQPNISFQNTGSYAVGGPIEVTGYLVDADGNIQFPQLGTLKVEGMTENALRAQLVKSLTDKKLLVDPIVTIRHLNFRITVLGEVNNPTVINVPSEKITLLEALGLAGDITVFGKKENVLVIREETGQKIVKRINLNTSEIFNSPYYYLRSNDIVYVEPTKARVASASRTLQILPIILSGLSFAAIIVDRALQ